jgi:hypothetical protein
LATASTRASAEPAFARVDRERVLLAFARVPVDLARVLLAFARLLLAALRVPEDPERLDFAPLARVLRDPLLELDLLDPPLLACGMLPPWTELAICCTLPRDGTSVCEPLSRQSPYLGEQLAWRAP